MRRAFPRPSCLRPRASGRFLEPTSFRIEPFEALEHCHPSFATVLSKPCSRTASISETGDASPVSEIDGIWQQSHHFSTQESPNAPQAETASDLGRGA